MSILAPNFPHKLFGSTCFRLEAKSPKICDFGSVEEWQNVPRGKNFKKLNLSDFWQNFYKYLVHSINTLLCKSKIRKILKCTYRFASLYTLVYNTWGHLDIIEVYLEGILISFQLYWKMEIIWKHTIIWGRVCINLGEGH